MAHELEIGADGVARMFYAGDVPWHGLGVGVEEAQTSAQAIKLAGLGGWNIQLRPMYVQQVGGAQDGEFVQYDGPRNKFITRGMDNKVLGVASDSYKIVSNESSFEFMDSLYQDGIMKYEAAGSLLGGSKVWLLAKMGEDMRIADDQYKNYLLLVTGHDSLTALRLYPTTVRVICNNTLRQATSNVPAAVSIAHYGDMTKRFEAARETLNVTTGAHARMKTWLDKLSVKKLTEVQVQAVTDGVFGSLDDDTSGRRREQIERFKEIYFAEQEQVGRTAYAVLNAITGYGDHMVSLHNRDDNQQSMLSFMEGTGAKFKANGIAVLSKVAQVEVPAGLAAK